MTSGGVVCRLALTKASLQCCAEALQASPEPDREEPVMLAPPRPGPGEQQPHRPPSSYTALTAVPGQGMAPTVYRHLTVAA